MQKEPPAGSSVPAAKNPSATAYEPPGVEWEEAVDVRVNLASACGQRPLQGGTCTGNELS